MKSSRWLYDQRLKKKKGAAHLIGVDEAGRGPLAGPVVAAAVILPPKTKGLEVLRDSKKLSPKKRFALYEVIRSQASAVSVAWSHPRRIDQADILSESLAAMGRAVRRTAAGISGSTSACLAVVDGNRPIPDLQIRQLTVIGGDDASLSVAAASVVAKVVRDRWMERLDRLHPGYGLAQHKGYGTRRHMEAIKKRGPSKVHRMSFAPMRPPRSEKR